MIEFFYNSMWMSDDTLKFMTSSVTIWIKKFLNSNSIKTAAIMNKRDGQFCTYIKEKFRTKQYYLLLHCISKWKRWFCGKKTIPFG